MGQCHAGGEREGSGVVGQINLDCNSVASMKEHSKHAEADATHPTHQCEAPTWTTRPATVHTQDANAPLSGPKRRIFVH